MADLQRKLEVLQEQVRRMNAEKLAAAAAPIVDPCTVHVAGLSPLMVPEVIAAHFSGCALHRCHIARFDSIWTTAH